MSCWKENTEPPPRSVQVVSASSASLPKLLACLDDLNPYPLPSFALAAPWHKFSFPPPCQPPSLTSQAALHADSSLVWRSEDLICRLSSVPDWLCVLEQVLWLLWSLGGLSVLRGLAPEPH